MEWVLLAALAVFLISLLASWIWLVRLAFIEGPPWGWSVLLFPPAGMVYGLLAWREAHRPLLIHLGMLLLSGMAYAMLISIRPDLSASRLADHAIQAGVAWVAELRKPEPWQVDPEVVGQPDPASQPQATAANEPHPDPTTDRQSPTTNDSPRVAPSAPAAPESDPQVSEAPTTRRSLPLKTRVIRVGAVEVEDRLAPFRALSRQERIRRIEELMWQPMVVCIQGGGTRKGTLEVLTATSLTLRQQLPSGSFDAIVQRDRIRDILLPKPRQRLTELHCN